MNLHLSAWFIAAIASAFCFGLSALPSEKRKINFDGLGKWFLVLAWILR